MFHEMLMCEPGVTNTKTSQDYVSVSGPLCEGTPSVDGGLNQGQLISGNLASIPSACQDSQIAWATEGERS